MYTSIHISASITVSVPTTTEIIIIKIYFKKHFPSKTVAK